MTSNSPRCTNIDTLFPLAKIRHSQLLSRLKYYANDQLYSRACCFSIELSSCRMRPHPLTLSTAECAMSMRKKIYYTFSWCQNNWICSSRRSPWYHRRSYRDKYDIFCGTWNSCLSGYDTPRA